MDAASAVTGPDGPIHRDAFVAYVHQVLVPDLPPGDIVITEDLSSHKATAAREAIEAAGAKLLFPTIPPDFNPGEPPTAFETPSVASSTSTRPRNAPATSPTPATMQTASKPL
jgi:hypothetical protein